MRAANDPYNAIVGVQNDGVLLPPLYPGKCRRSEGACGQGQGDENLGQLHRDVKGDVFLGRM